MNVKEEFIKWFFDNANGRYPAIKEYTIRDDMDQSNKLLGEDIFQVDETNYRRIVRFLREELYKKGTGFDIFSKGESNHRPRAILGKENYLKFLEEKFGAKSVENVNYWIFQGSPEIYDIKGALRAGHLKSWKVAAHKDRIQSGDKVIIWQSGREAGCYALAEVVSAVGEFIGEDDSEKQYYKSLTETDSPQRVQIKISKNLIDNPVRWEEIKELPEFKNFKAGNQGTNFSATQGEYEKLTEIGELKLKTDLFNLFREYLKTIEGPNNNTKEHYIDSVRINIPRLWIEKFKTDFYPMHYTKTNLEALKKITNDNYNGGFAGKLHFRTFLETLIAKKWYKQDSAGKNEDKKMVNSPLNKILYGPPGTGKTFKLQNKYFDHFTVRETSLSRKQYLENLISELTWWQVITIVMIDLKSARNNEIYEHELIKIKEGLSKSESIKQTLWGQLQVHTKMECENVKYKGRTEPLFFWKDKNSVWTVDEELVKDLYPEAFSLLEKSKSYSANPDKQIKNYEFVTFHQSFSYEDFVEGIKPKMEEQENDLSYEIKDGIFKKLCLRATADPENQYAIFIDEINRGNVSSIFGELITLIEDDKRIGEENALTVKLPYSKKEFGIPTNLHIIGTMNTADRSVEALDTALRRRFIFEELMPLPYLLGNISFNGFNLEEVLETINKRIEALLDRDHCIGHSYFIKIQNGDTTALEQTFQNKIIPLLQEYFYHDYEKIALILGEGFIERKEGKVVFANFKQLEDPEIIPSYELKKSIEDIEAALRKLLNHKDEEKQ